MRPLGFPRQWKNAVSISGAFSFNFLIRDVNIISKEHKPKEPFEIILHEYRELQALKVGWLTQSKKSCDGLTLLNQCSIFDYLSNFEGL